MELMEKYINTVGRSIPAAIRIAQENKIGGHPVWNTFYGYYSLRVKWWVKIKMVLKNGADKNHG